MQAGKRTSEILHKCLTRSHKGKYYSNGSGFTARGYQLYKVSASQNLLNMEFRDCSKSTGGEMQKLQEKFVKGAAFARGRKFEHPDRPTCLLKTAWQARSSRVAAETPYRPRNGKRR
jgi:hypothetical protein